MEVKVEPMNEKTAEEILKWTYETPYDFYNNSVTEEGMNELLNGSYYSLRKDDQELLGFYCTGEAAQVPIGYEHGVYNEPLIDMGLGMNPGYTGKGSGYQFVSTIMDFIKEKSGDIPIRLTVAEFNKRAIHLYEKLGFVKEGEFSTPRAAFITMVKRA
ncbi:GNAT family N-acetyltransferase [Fictibacillus barbaricus]|uniref:RimJ/RimL family protein N-acetyltransferase n=1 Tax=Fictibacillus barbaricus TaxID=182136 RepID=A0ABU1TWT5_9BACL|nr:GNAT family protein [Fictibacillus barbaricus]MDR7071654.1 RimJ/RimL family protein N-acetyltransferase [Fictibacillus barbaricus]